MTPWAPLGSRSWLAFIAVGAGATLFAFGLSTTWLWVIGAAIAAAAAAWWAWDAYTADRLRKEMQEFARDHGWEMRPYSAAVEHRFSGYPFAGGTNAWREGILEGTYGGRRCATFTHIMEQRDGDGDLAAQLPFQVTLAELDVALPRLDIVPESFSNRLAQALGGVDVEMESHEFNKRWRVKCDDRRYATDVVDPRMMQRLIAPDMPEVALRIENGAVMMWAPGRKGVGDLAKRLDILVGVANRIPQHVLRHYREQGRGIGGATSATFGTADGWGVRPAPGPADNGEGLTGPAWATHGGVLNSRRYTGIGVDADGDGVDDSEGRTR